MSFPIPSSDLRTISRSEKTGLFLTSCLSFLIFLTAVTNKHWNLRPKLIGNFYWCLYCWLMALGGTCSKEHHHVYLTSTTTCTSTLLILLGLITFASWCSLFTIFLISYLQADGTLLGIRAGLSFLHRR